MQNETLSSGPMPTEEAPRRSLWGPLYVVAWLAIASAAIAYLAALALSPDAVRISFTPGKVDDRAGLKELIDESRIEGAEVARGLQSLKAEVAALRADLAELASARLDEASALTAPGGQTQPETVVAAPPPAKAEVVPAQETGAIATAAEPKAAGEDELAVALQRAGMADAEPDWSSDVAAQTAEGVVKAKVFGLEIAQATSPEALQISWEVMSRQHDDVLGGLSAVARAPDEGEDGYRLVAGPFKSAQSAKSACARMSAAGLTCSLTAFEGEAF